MRDLLELIVGEWRSDFLSYSAVSFLASVLAIAFFFRARRRQYSNMLGRFTSIIGKLYPFFAVMSLQLILGYSFSIVELLLYLFPNPTLPGWATLCVSAAYAAAFYYSLYLFLILHPKGLYLMRIFLLSIPLFILALPLACIAFGAAWAGEVFSWNFYQQTEALTLFIGYCLLVAPWWLYLRFSAGVKNAWATINCPQKT